MEERNPSDYSYIFANEGHQSVASWEDFLKHSRWGSATLGLYYKNEYIGRGSLDRMSSPKRRMVHTSDVRLTKKARNKGHGIHLYFALIEVARSLGCEVIYSDWSLNRHSGRMWRQKLPQYYKVRRRGGCVKCAHGGRFHIDLKECPKPSQARLKLR